MSTDTDTSRRSRGRPRKPQLVQTLDGWSVRYWTEQEGELVRKQVPLGTKSRAVARARMAKVIATNRAPEPGAVETFEEAARRVVPLLPLRGKGQQARMSRLERFAFPLIGKRKVTDVDSTLVQDVIDDAVEHHGGRTQGVKHLFSDLSRVLGRLYGDKVLSENPCDRLAFGGVQRVRLPPCVPTLGEFERMARYHVAIALGRGTVSEALMLTLASRLLGGMRTSDLHAFKWDGVDTRDWQWALVPRPKKKKDGAIQNPVARHTIPADLVPILQMWWRQHHEPLRGPVFPMRRDKVIRKELGEGGTIVTTRRPAGGQKTGNGITYADDVRELFWQAGVIRPAPGFELARTDEERRELCELQSGGDECGPMDFHSMRRAYVTDVAADESVSMQQAMELVDHADSRTHLGYKAKSRVLVAPEKTVPRILPLQTAEMVPATRSNSNDYGRARRELNARPIASEAVEQTPGHAKTPRKARFQGPPSHAQTPPNTSERQNSAPVILAHADTLSDDIRQALEDGDDELAQTLMAERRRRRRTLPQAAE